MEDGESNAKDVRCNRYWFHIGVHKGGGWQLRRK